MRVQSVWKSVIFIIGFASAISEGILGILLIQGIVSSELAGSIIAAFALILGWCNANNPSSADQYILRPEDTQQICKPQPYAPQWHDIEDHLR